MLRTNNDNYTNNNDGPGTIFNRSGIRTIVPANRTHLRNLFSDRRYDLYIKYGLANAVRKNQDVDIWKTIYLKMLGNKPGEEKFVKFTSLIDNVLGNGELDDNVILVDNAFNILDGGHRLAALAAKGEHPLIQVLDYPSGSYSDQWLASNQFDSKELALIRKAKKDFFSRHVPAVHQRKLGFVWGSTINDLDGSWDLVLDNIGIDNLLDFNVRNFGSQIDHVIDLAYSCEAVTINSFKRKNKWISARSNGLLGLVTYKDEDNGSIRDIKERVRANIREELSDYFFDSIIHSIDIAHPDSNKIRIRIQDVIDKMNALLYI